MQGKPGPGYREKREAVTDKDFLKHLALAEEGSVADPHHRVRRIEVDGIVYDRNEEGVMLSFTVDGDDVIWLSFSDLFQA